MKRLFTFMMLLVASTAISFAVTWTVAGTAAAVNGSASWAQSNSQNDMVSEDDVNYALTITGCTLEKGVAYEYKVVKDYSWTECYPSANKVFTVSETAVYTVVYKFNATTHDVSEEVTKTGAVGEITHAYTVAGTFAPDENDSEASFFTESWNPALEDNDLTKRDDGIYFKVYENVTLQPGYIYYKVVADHSWDAYSWGFNGNNADYYVPEAGQYNITFTFNPTAVLENGYNLACSLEKVVESEIMLGDVNDDGKVDVRDYIAVANDILGIAQTGFNKKAADVTEDGIIDVTDYLGVGNIIHTGSPFGNSEASRKAKKTVAN